MNTDTIFQELQAQIKFLDSNIDPLKSDYPKDGIMKAIDSFLTIVDNDFQLRTTYKLPIEHFSKMQFAEVDFFLVGQNLEHCVAEIIRAFRCEKFTYMNCDKNKSYKTLKDHLQILSELQKKKCVSYTSCKNITSHLVNYRNTISHESTSPSNSNVRREYVRGTIGSLILIIYYVVRSGLANNKQSQGGKKNHDDNSVQSILDSLL